MKTRTLGILFGVFSTVIFATSGWSTPRFRLTDIGPGSLSGLNNRGTVLASDPSGNAFIYEHGRKTKITVTLSPQILNSCFTGPPLLAPPIAVAINDRGNVLLGLYTSFFFSPITECLVLVRGEKLTFLGSTGPAYAIALNNRDQVIGDTVGLTMFHQDFGFGAKCGLSNPGDFYQAFGINNRGDIVGTLRHNSESGSPVGPYNARAALCRAGGRAWMELGGLGSGDSQASAINERRQIVGNATTSAGDQHGFLYERGEMIDLGTLSNQPGSNSFAADINDEGEIVGWSDIDWQHDPEPFISFDHRLLSLQKLIDTKDKLFGYVTLLVGGGIFINDLGEIAIEGIDSRTNAQHVYLMTPTHGRDHWEPGANWEDLLRTEGHD